MTQASHRRHGASRPAIQEPATPWSHHVSPIARHRLINPGPLLLHAATDPIPQSNSSPAWENPDPLWEVAEWSTYVGISSEYTRQLIKQRRVASVKIGGKLLLRKSTADSIIRDGTRPASQPLNTDRFGTWC